VPQPDLAPISLVAIQFLIKISVALLFIQPSPLWQGGSSPHCISVWCIQFYYSIVMNLSTYVLYVSHYVWMYLSCYLLLMLVMKFVLSPLGLGYSCGLAYLCLCHDVAVVCCGLWECEFWDSFSHVMPDAVMPMLGLNKTVYG
jgi:hypothetical protein